MWPRLGRQARPGGWEQVLGLLQSAPDFGARDEGRGPAEEGIPAAPPPHPVASGKSLVVGLSS